MNIWSPLQKALRLYGPLPGNVPLHSPEHADSSTLRFEDRRLQSLFRRGCRATAQVLCSDARRAQSKGITNKRPRCFSIPIARDCSYRSRLRQSEKRTEREDSALLFEMWCVVAQGHIWIDVSHVSDYSAYARLDRLPS